MPSSSFDLSQTRTFHLQVYRSSNWVDIPVESVTGSQQKGMSGQLTVTLSDKEDDTYRSRIYEGEKVRAFRGIIGSPTVRCWTGYADAPTSKDQFGFSRQVVVTDMLKELDQAILIQGVVYDNLTLNAACVDIINQAITTGQFTPTDDNGNPLTTTTGYNQPSGNSICYFPDLFNADGTPFLLASGAVGSFTNASTYSIASIMVPIASNGVPYTVFELPNQYLIASTMSFIHSGTQGFQLASTSALPPVQGTVIADYFNGLLYFNALDGNLSCSFTGSYYDSPNWAFAPGAQVGAAIQELLDKSGFRLFVDGNGKFQARYIDAVVAPYHVYSPSEYQHLEVQTNRDRKNVIVCEGWDGNCGQIITSKAINYEDINNPPPRGLGKRQYMILRDPTWKKQSACNNAAYFAMQQIGRRGKVAAVQVIDDPQLKLEAVVMFQNTLPEVSDGDFFYVESINWNYQITKNGGFNATSQITATGLNGRGTVFLGPATAVTSLGSYDFSVDSHPIGTDSSLSPPGGHSYSTFSKSAAFRLNYTALVPGVESITIFGSDGTKLGPYATNRGVIGSPYNVVLPVASMTAGVYYVVQLKFQDQYGNIGIYRDFSYCLP